MNEIRRLGPTSADYDRIREIVAKHLKPNLIRDFSVEFGDYDDEAAMWITFETVGPRPIQSDRAGREARAAELRRVKDAVHEELTATFKDRYPFYRFAESRPTYVDRD